MQAQKINYSSKSTFSDSLYKNYQWFYDNFFVSVNEAIQEFLNHEIGLKLISVSEKENIFFSGEDYFVTKLRISKNDSVMVRVSKYAIQTILDVTLGESPQVFDLENITELEAKVLTGLNDFIYKRFSSILLDLNTFARSSDNTNDVHFTFFVQTKTMDLGKLIISIPIAALPELPEKESVYNFSIENFPNTMVLVDLEVGSSRLPLHDVKNIEAGDIVVLENSNINKMILINDDERQTFKISPNPALIVSLDDGEMYSGGNIMEQNITRSENMWDSIQVDISAEFEQVKIPLGDLRQISEGLVVDIGSVYDNRIDLKVENKVIASGELVIINDRYGVRVDTVINEPAEQPVNIKAVDKAEEAPSSGNSEEEFNEDDFDYSNFEIDDEEI